MKYKSLTAKSPEYSASYWEECRAFYRGGRDLLENKSLLTRVFPQHANEAPDIYQDRCRRATYLAYAGELLDYIVASLAMEPLTLTAEPKPPAFYQDFVNSTDGKSLTLNDLIQQQVLTALICKTAWTLVDLPPLDSGAVIESEADEEEYGLLRAMAFPVEPECARRGSTTFSRRSAGGGGAAECGRRHRRAAAEHPERRDLDPRDVVEHRAE